MKWKIRRDWTVTPPAIEPFTVRAGSEAKARFYARCELARLHWIKTGEVRPTSAALPRGTKVECK